MPQRLRGDMGRADAIAACDGGQALHRRIEQTPERLGLCLTELRIFSSHVSNRAVMLTEFLAADRHSLARWPGGGSGRVAIGGQCLGECPDLTGRRCRLYDWAVLAFEFGHLAAGELGHRLRPGAFGQEPQGAGGQVVVGVLEGAAAVVGDREEPGQAGRGRGCRRPWRSWSRSARPQATGPGAGEQRPASGRACCQAKRRSPGRSRGSAGRSGRACSAQPRWCA